jgi:uncharacterized membrane protein (UPF0127 family)
MPVLIENSALIVGRRALEARHPGGWPALAGRFEPSRTCADADLACISFDEDMELVATLRSLAAEGLLLEADGEPGEVAIVSQTLGPGGWWPWLELARVPGPGPGGPTVLAARLACSVSREVVCPDGWRFEGSSTQTDGVRPLSVPDRPLRHVRREGQQEVYLDRFTGEEVRLRRSGPPIRLVLEAANGHRKATVSAEVVREPLEQEVGLMFRETLAPGAGMLFIHPTERRHPFWMKNTLVQLDLLFLGRDGTVVGVVPRAPPLTLAHRCAGRASRDVLEVPGGWAAEHGAVPGDRVRRDDLPEVRP